MLNKLLVKRLLLAAGLLAGFLLCSLAALTIYGSLSKADIADLHPMPGRLVDVGSHKLHLNCTGEGEQTVVFESGGGSWSHDWVFVTQNLSGNIRACTYDRAGFGWSENADANSPRDFDTMVNELHILLTTAGEQGPYVLVGASMGGAIVQLFAQKFPQQVSAILLLDARGKRSVTDLLAIEPSLLPSPAVTKIARVLASLNIVHGILKIVGAERVLNDGHPNLKTYASSIKDIYLDTNVLNKNLIATFNEAASDAQSEKQLDALEGLGNTPLIVVTHGYENRFDTLELTDDQRKDIENEWLRQQGEIAQLSSQSRLVVAQASGHLVQLDQPMMVVELINELLEYEPNW